VAIPPVPQAHASEEPRAYCRRVGDGDTLRPIPEALVGAAGRRLGLDAPDDVVRRMVVYRCMARAVMICGTGANLACGKANAAPARPEVAAYCRENPDAGVVPMVVTGLDAVQGWRCRAGRAEAEGPAAAIDGRGFLARNWQVLR
jgi:hypothetical protein